MTKGKRTNIEIKARVIKAKLDNIDMSSHDIERTLKEEGIEVSNDTVCDIINKDLPHLATPESKLAELLLGDIEIMTTIQKKKKDRLAEAKERVKDNDLDTWENTAFKRSQLIQGKNTEQIGFTSKPTPEQAEHLLSLL